MVRILHPAEPRSADSRWRRLRPASWSLLAAAVLGAGWIRFSPPAPDAVPPSVMATSSAASLDASSAQIEEREPVEGTIVRASASNSAGSALAGEQDAEARLKNLILGQWEDEYRGKRRLTVNADGTGRMLVEPEGIGKKLFAAELKFDIEWILRDGRVTLKMLRGEPKSKVRLILKLYGSEAEYKIMELTEERMLLLDADGTTQYDWRRPGQNDE
jgi:hypothetical protein